MVGTQIHTAPEAFGKVMSTVKPRMAVAYHFFKDFTGEVFGRILKTYDGPLSLAEDYMVSNVTKEEVRVRLALVEEHTWAPAMASPVIVPDLADRKALSDELGWEVGYSDFIVEGKLDYRDVLEPSLQGGQRRRRAEVRVPFGAEVEARHSLAAPAARSQKSTSANCT